MSTPTGTRSCTRTGSAGPGAASTVRLCRDGHPDLPGPLCHGVITKDGTVHLVGYGRANHAGLGDDDVLRAVIAEKPLPPDNEANTDGNRHFYGFECENLGDGKDPWPAAQLEAIERAAAAVCRHHGWTHARSSATSNGSRARSTRAASRWTPCATTHRLKRLKRPWPCATGSARPAPPPCGPGCRRPLQRSRTSAFARHGVRLLLKRDDLIHPELPGNKWRKLAPNLRPRPRRADRAAHLRRRLLQPSARHRRRGPAARLRHRRRGPRRGAGRPPAQPVAGPLRGRRHAAALRRPRHATAARTSPEVLAASCATRFGDVRTSYPRAAATPLPHAAARRSGRELRGRPGRGRRRLRHGRHPRRAWPRGSAPGQRALGFPVLKGGGIPRGRR